MKAATRKGFGLAALAFCGVLASFGTAAQQPSAYERIFGDPEYLAREQGLTDAEKVGRRVWLYATAGNSRFHTYVMQQRLGILVDWYRVLSTDRRDERFSTWGAINDPGCCVPGSADCPARSKDETYGLDWCPGDEELLRAVGVGGYRDPACDLSDAAPAQGDPHGAPGMRQSACDLEMGTSTGILGLRKFPNPKFDRERWRALNGRLDTWAGFEKKLDDGSVEPPFLIGMACAACHIAFNPVKPPSDPAHPTWANIDPLIGNQYSRFSELLASGMPTTGLEWQIFAHARPGTVDTSAVPNDTVNNPGTINAIINFAKRPLHEHDLVKWRATAACSVENDTCWCEPGKPGKCWQQSRATEMVPNILKGGEDSIGFREAVQRVYVNIGSCSEQSWVNHLVDLRQTDPAQRLFHQTPFDIGQARRDCANFRAIEDRLGELVAFLASARPSDLYVARGLKSNDALVAQLESVDGFARGAVERGRVVFAANCARCHASVDGRAALVPAAAPLEPLATRDYRAEDPAVPGLRLDWLGNDELTPASEVGTYRARALHSNHMVGHVWQAYGSETLHAKPPVDALPEPTHYKDGGRGYYRNISLLSVWATAPFLHNNALGPELCGPTPASDPTWAADPRRNLYRSPYVAIDAAGKLQLDANENPLPHPNPPACRPYDPSVAGRFALFKDSMRELLNPGERIPKITRVAEEVVIPVGPRYVFREGVETGLDVHIPAGTPAVVLANLRYKELLGDLVIAAANPNGLDAQLAARWQSPEDRATVAALVRDVLSDLASQPGNAIDVFRGHRADIQRFYSNSTAIVENEGHEFGESLPAEDKDALTAFLATL